MNDDAGVRDPIRIGISPCLLGQAVRFDGGHKRDPFLTETFGAFVEWVPVCPEVECGFGTPRQSMRLVRVENDVRLLTVRTAVDLTAWRRTCPTPPARRFSTTPRPAATPSADRSPSRWRPGKFALT
jgi:hypothetical protein